MEAREDSQILLIHLRLLTIYTSDDNCPATTSFPVACRQDWVVPGTHPTSLTLTPQQRHRRSVYFQTLTPVTAGHQRNTTALVTASEIRSWVTRELQAITLEEDVNLVCQVVMATVSALAASVCVTGTRYLPHAH